MKPGAITKALKEIPWIVKALVVAGAALGIYAGVSRQIKKAKDNKAAKDAVKAADDELQALVNAGAPPSYSDTQYKLGEDTIYSAINNSRWSPEGGTDEEAIYRVFNSLKNSADLLKLISAFGVRDDESLAAALRDDLDSEEMQKINQILSSKNIAYSF